MGPIEASICAKIEAELKPDQYELENESHKHRFSRGPEGHFKLTILSAEFEGLSKVARHQKIYAVLKSEMASGVHALAIRAVTPSEQSANPLPFESPRCHNKG